MTPSIRFATRLKSHCLTGVYCSDSEEVFKYCVQIARRSTIIRELRPTPLTSLRVCCKGRAS